MMKIKNVLIIAICIVLVAFTLGATGAISVKDESVPESTFGDRLIGVLIVYGPPTEEEEKQMVEDLLNNHNFIDDISDYEPSIQAQRMYATLEETSSVDENGNTYTRKEYVFKGVNGIRFMIPIIYDESQEYFIKIMDEGISDGVAAMGNNISLKGTIYVDSKSETRSWPVYPYPVYETAKGEVYATHDWGISWDMTKTFSGSMTDTFGGKKYTFNSKIEISAFTVEKPESISILQFNGKNELLEKADYIPCDLPERIESIPGAQYIIVETATSDEISREIFQRGNGISAFHCRDDGIRIKHNIPVTWND